MGKKKPQGHYCRICGRRRANEKFGGRGHSQHICKDCRRELKQAARQKRKAMDADNETEELADEEILETLLDDCSEAISAPSKSAGKKGIPYDELDPNIVKQVQALNRYPGVTTVGSCSGREIITNPSLWQAGTWYVKFNLPSGRFGVGF